MDEGQTGDETYHLVWELEFFITCSLPFNMFEIFEHELKYTIFIVDHTTIQ
jgi:hypothetical protein